MLEYLESQLTLQDSLLAKDSSIEIPSILQEVSQSLSLKNYDKAEELITFLALKSSENSEFYLKLGHLMYKEARYTKAEYYYNLALDKPSSPLMPEILFGLGQSLYQAKKFSDSFFTFTRIENSFPQYKYIDIVYLKLALIMKELKELTSSFKYLIKILQNPNALKNIVVEAMCTAGKIFELQGRKRVCLKFYCKASEVMWNFRSVTCVAWEFLTRNPVFSKSICLKFLRKSRIQYEHADVGFLLSLVYLKLEKFEEAAGILQKQLAMYPMNIFYIQYLGIIFFHLEAYGKALEMFQSVLTIKPFSHENLNNLAITYLKLGLTTEAHQSLNTALLLQNISIESCGRNHLDSATIVEPFIDILEFPLNTC